MSRTAPQTDPEGRPRRSLACLVDSVARSTLRVRVLLRERLSGVRQRD